MTLKTSLLFSYLKRDKYFKPLFFLIMVPLLSLSACSTYLGDFDRVETYKLSSEYALSEDNRRGERAGSQHSDLTDTEVALRHAVLHFETALPDFNNGFSLRPQKHLPFTNAESRYHFYSSYMKSDRLGINRFLRVVEAIVWQYKARLKAFENIRGQTHDLELDSHSIHERSQQNLRLIDHGFQAIEQRLMEYEQAFAYAALHTPSPLIDELQLSLKLMRDRLGAMRQTYVTAMGHGNMTKYEKYHGKVVYK